MPTHFSAQDIIQFTKERWVIWSHVAGNRELFFSSGELQILVFLIEFTEFNEERCFVGAGKDRLFVFLDRNFISGRDGSVTHAETLYEVHSANEIIPIKSTHEEKCLLVSLINSQMSENPIQTRPGLK